MRPGGTTAWAGFRRAATRRFAAFGAFGALLTGLGLYFVAGLRDPGSWLWFFVSSSGAIVVLVWWVRAALPPTSARPEAVPSMERSAEEVESAPLGHELESSDPEAGDERVDDVDYLMALRHEFRTPLNAVLGFADVLLSGIDGEVNESQREDLEIIRASGIRLKLLLDNALDLSQLVDQRLRLNPDRTDVRELVTRVSVEAEQLWSNKRSPRCELPDEPCMAEADADRLRRSVLVLADFLATDHRDSRISLRLSSTGGHVSIEISADQAERPSIDALPTTVEARRTELERFITERVAARAASFDIQGIVRQRLEDYSLDDLEALILSATDEHLTWLQILGWVIGAVAAPLVRGLQILLG